MGLAWQEVSVGKCIEGTPISYYLIGVLGMYLICIQKEKIRKSKCSWCSVSGRNLKDLDYEDSIQCIAYILCNSLTKQPKGLKLLVLLMVGYQSKQDLIYLEKISYNNFILFAFLILMHWTQKLLRTLRISSIAYTWTQNFWQNYSTYFDSNECQNFRAQT